MLYTYITVYEYVVLLVTYVHMMQHFLKGSVFAFNSLSESSRRSISLANCKLEIDIHHNDTVDL